MSWWHLWNRAQEKEDEQDTDEQSEAIVESRPVAHCICSQEGLGVQPAGRYCAGLLALIKLQRMQDHAQDLLWTICTVLGRVATIHGLKRLEWRTHMRAALTFVGSALVLI